MQCVLLPDSESAIHIYETHETRRRSVHQRIQQTPGTAIGTEVPGVPDREAGQRRADGGASETSLRRHLYRQLQPLPQTDGGQEVPQLSANGKEEPRRSWKQRP